MCSAGVALLVSCGGAGRTTTSLAPEVTDSLAPSPIAVSGPTPVVAVKVGEIREAVRLVEQRLGGAQRYSEVNATQTEVNVFVVLGSGVESAYLVHNGVVDPPSGDGAYSGPTFVVSDLAFAPTVLDRVARGISDSELVAFSVTPHDGGGVDYIATLTAPSGEFRVLLSADGAVISTSAISPQTGS